MPVNRKARDKALDMNHRSPMQRSPEIQYPTGLRRTWHILILQLFLVAVAAFFMIRMSDASAETVRQVPQSRDTLQMSFAPVVKAAAPGVVNVHAKRLSRRSPSPFFDDPFFRHFFGDDRRSRPGPSARSLGSGVIVRADGLVVTNHHVIADAEEIRVVLADKREYPADIVLRDERTDLAVLKINSDDEAFAFVHLAADSEALEVGDLVLAIGNPFGVGQTVTSGIVSALARTQVGVSDYQFFIQTDAAINPGNSGGALIDMNGHLVGINTAIFTRSGGSNGIGFAIPVNMVRRVIDAAAAGTSVKRAWLGAQLQGVSADMLAVLALERPMGAIVTHVFDQSPAARAGLRIGDVILALDGKPIENPDSFSYRFATKALGGKSKIDILRGNRRQTLDVALEPPAETVPRQEMVLSGPSPFSGATVANLSPAVSEELSLANDERGVAVVQVKRGSPAARIGLRKGDIVRIINGVNIRKTADLRDLIRERRTFWRFSVERGGRLISTIING